MTSTEPPPLEQPAPALRERGRIPRTAALVATAAVILLCAFLVARYRTARVPVVRAPRSAAQPAPPQQAAAELDATKPNPFAQPAKTPPKPREAEVATAVSLELIGNSGIRNVFETLSPRRIFGSGGDKTTPPHIVRQILPGIYPALAARIHGTRQIDVKITIGADGQVVKTELLGDPATDPIDSAVYNSARQWTFEPARIGNRPVESKLLMHFVLKRSS